jgi:hypothetical protein
MEQFAALGPDVLTLLKKLLPSANSSPMKSNNDNDDDGGPALPAEVGVEHIPAICMLAKFFGLQVPPGWEDRVRGKENVKPSAAAAAAIAAARRGNGAAQQSNSNNSSKRADDEDAFVPIERSIRTDKGGDGGLSSNKKTAVFNSQGCVNCAVQRSTVWNIGKKRGERACRRELPSLFGHFGSGRLTDGFP